MQIFIKGPKQIHVPQMIKSFHFGLFMSFPLVLPSGQNASIAHKLQYHLI